MHALQLAWSSPTFERPSLSERERRPVGARERSEPGGRVVMADAGSDTTAAP